VDVLHVKVEIRLGREDCVADVAVGDAPVDPHVVVQRVLVGVALAAHLTAKLLGPTAAPRSSI
jgi:hypothetical protein